MVQQQEEWHWFGRQNEVDDADTRITFNDVVFGIVIATLFTEAVAIETYPWPVVIHLLLAFVITLGSYIGYRKSSKRSKAKIAFFNLPLLQFALDLFMIYFYYRLSVTPYLSVTPEGTVKPPATVDPRTDAIIVFYIFVLYLLWDLVSLWMKHRNYNVAFSTARTFATGVCLAISGAVAAIANFTNFFHDLTIFMPFIHDPAVAIDLSLVAIAVVYRWVKDGLYPPSPPSGQLVTQSGQVVMPNRQVVTVTITPPAP